MPSEQLLHAADALGGDLGVVFSFMIVPTQVGQPVPGGFDCKWNGLIRFRKQLNFVTACNKSAKDGRIAIGDSQFDLTKGIFCVAGDPGVTQIFGSKAGRKNDPSNVKRLAEISGNETSEQGGASGGGKPSN